MDTASAWLVIGSAWGVVLLSLLSREFGRMLERKRSGNERTP